MKIPFTDLLAQYKEIKKQADAAISKVIKKSDFILGEDVKSLEKEFGEFCGARFAVGVSSGTAALFLALKSLDIGSGDEVIVPAFTYIATALAVSYTGAKPVFVDVEEDTYNIDAGKIRKALTKNTKAIIPVHLYGQPANMPEILSLARAYGLRVIEDAAQAHGAKIKMPDGKWHVTGGIGDIGCFSFYPTKNLGGLGDGGMVTTNDEETYKRLLMLRDYGRVSRYEHAMVGYNSRLDTLQAAVLRLKLKKLNHWNKMRRKAANIYDKLLKDTPGVVIPGVSPSVEHVYHVYAIRTEGRDELSQRFKNKGVGAIIHYPIPLHLQKAYKFLGYREKDFPVSEKICREIISLPMFPHLKASQVNYIARVIKENLGR